MHSTRAFTEGFLPQANSQAIASGAYGGSRNGVTNALGIDRFTENLTDTMGQLLQNNYQTERDRQQQAPGMLAQAFGIEQNAANAIRQAGSEQQGFAQQEIDEFRTLDNLSRTQPFDLVDRLFGALGQVGDRSTTNSNFNNSVNNSTSNSTTQSNSTQTTQGNQTSNLSGAALQDLQSQTAGRNANTQAQGLQNDRTAQILQSMPFQNQVQINNFAKQMFPDLYLQNPQAAVSQFIQQMQQTPLPFGQGVFGGGQP